jgi:hypothetical protein
VLITVALFGMSYREALRSCECTVTFSAERACLCLRLLIRGSLSTKHQVSARSPCWRSHRKAKLWVAAYTQTLARTSLLILYVRVVQSQTLHASETATEQKPRSIKSPILDLHIR